MHMPDLEMDRLMITQLSNPAMDRTYALEIWFVIKSEKL